MMDDTFDINNLEFEEKLGEGGEGSVHRVTFKKPYKCYTEAAAKTIHSSFRKEEVEILSKLSHPHITIGFYEKGPMKLILTEYAKNGSLHSYLSNEANRLPLSLKRKWIKEAALAIQYLHGHACLHRDIKGNNCLLFQDHTLKLCDFGLAREIDGSFTLSSQKGTYQYMAPEIIKTDDDDQASYSRYADLYAYGMLIQEIWTRKPPYRGMDYSYVIFQVGNGDLQPDIASDCPSDLTALMKRCWKHKPRERPSIDSIVEVIMSDKESENRRAKPTLGPFNVNKDQLVGLETTDQKVLSDSEQQQKRNLEKPKVFPKKVKVRPSADGIQVVKTEATTRENKCVKPPARTSRFYCQTCHESEDCVVMKQHCYGHDSLNYAKKEASSRLEIRKTPLVSAKLPINPDSATSDRPERGRTPKPVCAASPSRYPSIGASSRQHNTRTRKPDTALSASGFAKASSKQDTMTEYKHVAAAKTVGNAEAATSAKSEIGRTPNAVFTSPWRYSEVIPSSKPHCKRAPRPETASSNLGCPHINASSKPDSMTHKPVAKCTARLGAFIKREISGVCKSLPTIKSIGNADATATSDKPEMRTPQLEPASFPWRARLGISGVCKSLPTIKSIGNADATATSDKPEMRTPQLEPACTPIPWRARLEISGVCKSLPTIKSIGYDKFRAFSKSETRRAPNHLPEPEVVPWRYVSISSEDLRGVRNGGTWKNIGQFSTAPDLIKPRGITIHPGGEVAITNGSIGQAKIFSNDGHLKYSFERSSSANLYDISISKDRYILPGCEEILFYDSHGIRLKSPHVRTIGVDNKRSTPKTLAVDSRGRIVAGLGSNTISIHDGERLVSKFATPSKPCRLDVTSNGDIAVTFYDCTVQVMDYSGRNARVVRRPHEVVQWYPHTVCCSKQDEMFVVSRSNAGNDKVYRYRPTADGNLYLGCIITGLDDPQGIAITDDGQQLYVVECMSSTVKIFKRP